MNTKRCPKCQLVKSSSEFYTNAKHDLCKDCQTLNVKRNQQIGRKILQDLAEEIGQCQHCQRPYSLEDWDFFEFDHIDPTLKKRRDTHPCWVKAHLQEFHQKIKPNLQLLCVKCHKLKTKKDVARGGGSHQSRQQAFAPAQVLDFGWNLFNPIPTPETDDYTSWSWSLVRREGDWIVQRDIDGRIINSELAK